MEAQPEVRYVHTTLYSVRMPSGVSHRKSKIAKPRHIFSALTSERLEQIELVKNKSLRVLASED